MGLGPGSPTLLPTWLWRPVTFAKASVHHDNGAHPVCLGRDSWLLLRENAVLPALAQFLMQAAFCRLLDDGSDVLGWGQCCLSL